MRDQVCILWFVPVLLLVGALRLTAAERPREIREIVESSPSAPPELAADVLIRISELTQVEPQWKAEILDKAFRIADGATYEIAQIPTTPAALNAGSDAAVRSVALSAGLDKLSLRCRAIKAMLRIDPKRALELFLQVPVIHLPRHVCDDSMTDSPAIFFETLGQILNLSFTPEERAGGKDIDLAEYYLREASSSSELGPAIKMIVGQKLSPASFARLAGIVDAGIQQMNNDDRTFTATVRPLMNDLLVFSQRCNDQYPRTNLIASIRAYLVRHLQAIRCEESVNGKEDGFGDLFNDESGARIGDLFNRTFLPMVGDWSVAPIRPEETEPQSVAGSIRLYEFWTEPSAQKLMANLERLQFRTNEQGPADRDGPGPDNSEPYLTSEEKSTAEWRTAANEYLTELEEWKEGTVEPAEAYFHEICFLYLRLLDIVPPGELQQRVLRSYVDFLKISDVEHNSPPEWYLQVSRLILKGTTRTSGGNHILNELRAHGNGVMMMLTNVDLLLRRESLVEPLGEK